jgi:hypothetical protein
VQEEDPLRSELLPLLGDRVQLREDEAHLLQPELLQRAPADGAAPQATYVEGTAARAHSVE